MYEVEITNIGSEPFNLPWSADQPSFEGAANLRTDVAITIEAGGGNAAPTTLAVTRLMGHETVSDSLKTLMPGDRGRIRVRGTVHVWHDQIEQLDARGAVPIRARLRYQTPGVSFEQVVSAETTVINVRKRPKLEP